VFGVVDVLGGQAVHARGGHRDRYLPVRLCDGVPVDGDPVALARVYLERFGLEELYVADLDAILHRAQQASLIASLVALGASVWLDAGVSSRESAVPAIDLGVARVIVGLETLSSFEGLADICRTAGSARVAFSLDLRDGVPVVTGGDTADDRTPEVLAARAVDAGAGAVILLDLARVGSGRGVDLAMLARIRHAVPRVTLLAGGGIHSRADIEGLHAAGCDGALIATALHDGGITAADLAPYL
jgi:phosphoribosylformimino-5-aminoimidazole carboxamide ribotide isomerase